MSRRTKQVDALFEVARDLLMEEVKDRVRAILKGKNAAVGFTMCMGSAFFVDKNGDSLDVCGAPPYPQYRYLESFWSFLGEYDTYFHLTGSPLRIDSPDGEFYTDW